MKVNLNRNLLDFRGREFIELVNGKESKKSVRDLVAEALFAAGLIHRRIWKLPRSYEHTKCYNRLLATVEYLILRQKMLLFCSILYARNFLEVSIFFCGLEPAANNASATKSRLLF